MSVLISVECGDALTIQADVLALKYAQGLYGVDAAVVALLESDNRSIHELLPPSDGFRVIAAKGHVGADHVLFIGVASLRSFGYDGIRVFARRVLTALAGQLPAARHVALTLHGPGYGLDEAEAFRAEVAGLLDAITSGDHPPELERITIVERNPGRAERLSELLGSILPVQGRIWATHRTYSLFPGSDVAGALNEVGTSSKNKAHVFVAMPFATEFDDLFHYGIQGAVHHSGYLCERADLASFTGDVLSWIKERIATARFLIADLSTSNPNVYLEVGYAWGADVPTILLARNATDLKFDVRGQRCLLYQSIKHLEGMLRDELAGLGVVKQ